MVDAAENRLSPVKVLLLARSVEEAAVTVPEAPRAIEIPLTVTDELARSVFATVAHVPPETVKALRNWLVQVVPAMVENTPEVVIARPVDAPMVALPAVRLVVEAYGEEKPVVEA